MWVLRVEPDRFFQLCHGARDVAIGEPLHSRTDRKRRGLLVGLLLTEPCCFRECLFGSWLVLAALQDLTDAQPGFRRFRIEVERAPEFRKGLVGLSKLPQHRAEHVVRFRVVRALSERFTKRCGGVLGPAGLPEHDAKGEVRFREIGTQPDRLAQRLFGVGEVVLLLERGAEVVVRLGIRGLACRQVAELTHGGFEVALLHVGGAEVVARRAIRRSARDHRPERSRPRDLRPPLHVREAQAHWRRRRVRHRGEVPPAARQPHHRDRRIRGARSRDIRARWRAGCQPRTLTQLADRAVEIAELAECQAQVVAGVRLAADRAARGLEGGAEPGPAASHHQRVAPR